MNQYAYDLDSLCYMSTDVVQVRLEDAIMDDGVSVIGARVIHCYKGPMKTGQHIGVVALDFFAGIKANQPQPVLLFLVHASKRFLYNSANMPKYYWPVWSGVKLIDGNQVINYEQFCNPGPYEPVRPGRDKTWLPPTVADFNVSLQKSLKIARDVRPLLTKKPQVADAPALQSLIKSRPHTRVMGLFGRDQLAEAAWSQIIGIGNFKLTAQTLATTQSSPYGSIATSAFAGESGLDFLIADIGNVKTPMAERLALSSWLEYTSKFVEPDMNRYGNKIFDLALRDTRDNPAIQAIVISQIDCLAGRDFGRLSSFDAKGGLKTITDPGPATLHMLLERHKAALNALYAATGSEVLKYAIKKLFLDCLGVAALRDLDPGANHAIAMFDPVKFDRKSRKMTVHYELITLSQDVTDVLSRAWTIRDNASGRIVNLPKVDLIDSMQSLPNSYREDVANVTISLPDNIRPGGYQLILQLNSGNTVRCEARSEVIQID
ncbi:MAG TPA: hypothetical protein VGK19_13585 [Capsulimonadaceae bacterium]|jgi:hypothetical protein